MAGATGCGSAGESRGDDGFPPADQAEQQLSAVALTPTVDTLGRPLGPVSRAIIAANDTHSVPELLARVEIQENEILEFYAFGEGVLVSAAGAPERPQETAIQVSGATWQTVEELWQWASGGQPMPLALERALAERPVMGRPESSSPQPAEQGALASTPPAVTVPAGVLAAGWCSTTYYTYHAPGDWWIFSLGACPPSFDWSVCWDNVTGNGWARHPDVFEWRSNVCPTSGAVVATVTASEPAGGGGPPQGSWTVPQDTYRFWWFYDSDYDLTPFDDCPTIRTDIAGAGKIYNFRFQVEEQ